MPFRMLVYLVRIWKRHRKRERKHLRKRPSASLPVILAIVISNVEGGWEGPLSFHDLCEPHPTSIPGIAELVPQFTLVLEHWGALVAEAGQAPSGMDAIPTAEAELMTIYEQALQEGR
jgi:hypothetical protein